MGRLSLVGRVGLVRLVVLLTSRGAVLRRALLRY